MTSPDASPPFCNAAAGTRQESVRADMLARYPASFITNSSTFGRPLAAIGEQSFVLDPGLGALLPGA
ncbi:MAG: hypothetical protein P0Y59_20945 [Candidatus Sphingomonas phytovorans]|nr:hypothetical protein [Sphingomonas sp.]WEJ99363.1 MAG: hypothetical protein P0Y59_20945 [Sphingomonas sp.]